MNNVYLGRKPILDSNSNLFAYEILYKDENQDSVGDYNRHTSASVINSVLNKFCTKSLLGDRKAFVKIDEKFLLHDLIFTVPKHFFIFSIVESVEMNERVVERVQHLHQRGYELAINDITLNEKTRDKYTAIFNEITYMKIELDEVTTFRTTEIIREVQQEGIKIIAANIENSKKYTLARSLGVDGFEGYYFSKPKILINREYLPSRENVLKLYDLLVHDRNIDEITSEFEKNHEITLYLIQYINSGIFEFDTTVSSVHHILTKVGRIPLAQWLMLMIYSKSVSKKEKISPLMLMLRSRTELMENILKTIEPNAESNRLGEAYFVGILSLMGTAFGQSLDKTLREMNVAPNVKNALVNNEGLLGDIYALILDIETFDTEAIADFARKYYLDKDTIEAVVLESMENVNRFEREFTAQK